MKVVANGNTAKRKVGGTSLKKGNQGGVKTGCSHKGKTQDGQTRKLLSAPKRKMSGTTNAHICKRTPTKAKNFSRAGSAVRSPRRSPGRSPAQSPIRTASAGNFEGHRTGAKLGNHLIENDRQSGVESKCEIGCKEFVPVSCIKKEIVVDTGNKNHLRNDRNAHLVLSGNELGTSVKEKKSSRNIVADYGVPILKKRGRPKGSKNKKKKEGETKLAKPKSSAKSKAIKATSPKRQKQQPKTSAKKTCVKNRKTSISETTNAESGLAIYPQFHAVKKQKSPVAKKKGGTTERVKVLGKKGGIRDSKSPIQNGVGKAESSKSYRKKTECKSTEKGRSKFKGNNCQSESDNSDNEVIKKGKDGRRITKVNKKGKMTGSSKHKLPMDDSSASSDVDNYHSITSVQRKGKTSLIRKKMNHKPKPKLKATAQQKKPQSESSEGDSSEEEEHTETSWVSRRKVVLSSDMESDDEDFHSKKFSAIRIPNKVLKKRKKKWPDIGVKKSLASDGDDTDQETEDERRQATKHKVSRKGKTKKRKGEVTVVRRRTARMASLNALAMMQCMNEDARMSLSGARSKKNSMALVLRVSSESSSSEDSDSGSNYRYRMGRKRKIEESPANGKVRKKRRGELDVHMDMRDMVVTKRMASLNASAIMAASYSTESRCRKIPLNNSSNSESEFTVKKKISVKKTTQEDQGSTKTHSVITVQETKKKVKKDLRGRHRMEEVEEHIIVKQKKVRKNCCRRGGVGMQSPSLLEDTDREDGNGTDNSELDPESLTKKGAEGGVLLESSSSTIRTYITTQTPSAPPRTVTMSTFCISNDGRTTTLLKQVQRKSTSSSTTAGSSAIQPPTACIPPTHHQPPPNEVRIPGIPKKSPPYAPLAALTCMQPIMSPGNHPHPAPPSNHYPPTYPHVSQFHPGYPQPYPGTPIVSQIGTHPPHYSNGPYSHYPAYYGPPTVPPYPGPPPHQNSIYPPPSGPPPPYYSGYMSHNSPAPFYPPLPASSGFLPQQDSSHKHPPELPSPRTLISPPALSPVGGNHSGAILASPPKPYALPDLSGRQHSAFSTPAPSASLPSTVAHSGYQPVSGPMPNKEVGGSYSSTSGPGGMPHKGGPLVGTPYASPGHVPSAGPAKVPPPYQSPSVETYPLYPQYQGYGYPPHANAPIDRYYRHAPSYPHMYPPYPNNGPYPPAIEYPYPPALTYPSQEGGCSYALCIPAPSAPVSSIPNCPPLAVPPSTVGTGGQQPQGFTTYHYAEYASPVLAFNPAAPVPTTGICVIEPKQVAVGTSVANSDREQGLRLTNGGCQPTTTGQWVLSAGSETGVATQVTAVPALRTVIAVTMAMTTTEVAPPILAHPITSRSTMILPKGGSIPPPVSRCHPPLSAISTAPLLRDNHLVAVKTTPDQSDTSDGELLSTPLEKGGISPVTRHLMCQALPTHRVPKSAMTVKFKSNNVTVNSNTELVKNVNGQVDSSTGQDDTAKVQVPIRKRGRPPKMVGVVDLCDKSDKNLGKKKLMPKTESGISSHKSIGTETTVIDLARVTTSSIGRKGAIFTQNKREGKTYAESKPKVDRNTSSANKSEKAHVHFKRMTLIPKGQNELPYSKIDDMLSSLMNGKTEQDVIKKSAELTNVTITKSPKLDQTKLESKRTSPKVTKRWIPSGNASEQVSSSKLITTKVSNVSVTPTPGLLLPGNPVRGRPRKNSLLSYLKERNESDTSSVDSESGSPISGKCQEERIVGEGESLFPSFPTRKRRSSSQGSRGKSTKKPRWVHNWHWHGEPYEGKIWLRNDEVMVSRQCYSAMQHKEGDLIRVRDCVLLRSGTKKSDLPFVAKVAQLWEDPETTDMMMSILWYYRPEHTDIGRRDEDLPDEVFASKHRDHMSVACIDDRCYVLTFNEYCRYRRYSRGNQDEVIADSFPVPMPEDEYFRKERQPGGYVVPDLTFVCRKVYDYRQRRILKNPY